MLTFVNSLTVVVPRGRMVKHGYFDLCWKSESSIINNSAARSGFELRDTWNELVAVQCVINPVSMPDSRLFQNQPQFMTTTLLYFTILHTSSVYLDDVQGADDMANVTSEIHRRPCLVSFHGPYPYKASSLWTVCNRCYISSLWDSPTSLIIQVEELILHFMMSEQHKRSQCCLSSSFYSTSIFG